MNEKASKWKMANVSLFPSVHKTMHHLNSVKEKFENALAEQDVVGSSIATRPDCLPVWFVCWILADLK